MSIDVYTFVIGPQFTGLDGRPFFLSGNGKRCQQGNEGKDYC